MINTIEGLREQFHAFSYIWSHRHSLMINSIGLILAVAFSIYIFFFAKSRKERWIIASLLFALNLLVLIVGVLNKSKWGESFVDYALLGSGYIVLMDVAYAFHLTGKPKKWSDIIAYIVFFLSSIIFIYSFLFGELLPVNVHIDW